MYSTERPQDLVDEPADPLDRVIGRAQIPLFNEVSIAICCSGLPRMTAVYRAPRPIASTYTGLFPHPANG